MQKNDLLTLRAESLGAEMEGVCRHEGMAVFVPGLLPGEEAAVRIVRVEKRYAFGKMESDPVNASPDRVVPDCPVFPRCGGCTARHMSYAATLAAKRQHVRDCFERIGHLSVDVPPVLGMADPAGYRNKTSLPAGGPADDPQLGFFAPRSHRLIPAVHCPNAMAPTSEIAGAVQAWMRAYRIPSYNEETGQGLIRHLVVRVSRAREAMATLVINGKKLPHAEELARALSPPGVVSLYLNENTRRTNVIFGDRFQLISGRETLSDTLCGLRYELSPASFFQVNPVQTEVLYATALDFAAPEASDTLCDVYCGAGTISLMMAGRCRQVTGIEIVPAAVANARENAVRNRISNAVFHEGKAEEVLPRMVREGLRPEIIVVDPPRKGLEPVVIDAIAQAQPDRVVYVSCNPNPATQARDAALLAARGYQIRRIQPVDMFPFTSHVETVLLLSKGDISTKSIRIEFPLDELDTSCLLNDATYPQIKNYVLEHTGLKVSCLYIAQVKAKHGIIERDCYNKAKTEGNRVPKCPPDKEKAIEDALKHFQMIK